MRSSGNQRFSASLRKLRGRFGWSQEETARLLGYSWATVSRWERLASSPTPEAEAKAERLQTLAGRIGKAIAPANFTKFLTTANAGLRGYPPLELLQSAYSFEDLLDFVDGAQSGDMT